MFHMLSCFNLREGFTIDQFVAALDRFDQRMRSEGLLEKTGPVGKRQRHKVMDTDERDHEYFFLMTFKDRKQCDAAVAKVMPHRDPVETDHRGIQDLVEDSIFVCWQDVPEQTSVRC